ncbi:MAG: 30S ribosomal protein S16 [Anaerolineales bacterium]|nr:30S ribosomal protein S16 [Anaerolineales bacterium]
MVRIRLRRVGSRHQPSYRIIAADKESPRDGKFIENLGHYNPRTEPATVVIDERRLFHWIGHGAQPSDAVRKILKPLGTWDRWDRFKAGEDIDVLLQEAEDNKIEVDPRTRRDDLFGTRKAKKKSKKKVEDKEAPEVETAESEAEGVVEEPVEAEAEAPVEEATSKEAVEEAEKKAEESTEEATTEAQAELPTEETPEEEPEQAAEETQEEES